MEEVITAFRGLVGPYGDYVIAVLIIILSFIVAKIVSGMFTFVEKRVTSRTKTTADDKILAAFRGPIKLGILLFGLFLALGYLPVLAPYANEMQIAYTVIIPLYVAYIISRLIGAVIEWYSEEVAQKTKSKVDEQFLPIIKKVAYGIIFGIVIVVMLNQLGIRVETVIAAMGIGGLAVALALQPTLTNFFSGAQMVADRPLKIGDYIEIESLEKGIVTDIGWRSTKIRTFANNIVVLPNSKIADSKVINYSIPDSTAGFIVDCGVAYDSDLEHVEKIALEIARETMKKEGGVKNFEPIFRFREFGESSINFRVIMRGKTFGDTYALTHEFIKALKKRFDKEGIVIPFPQRDVHMDAPKPRRRKK
ncbi:MAG: mechanosensitive ion channel family protein [Candidatus Aenigmatarchaeota archaeon]|nr:MAG: mechanosensitive ion channel family protein [Candidatus Aenigmarchaeota archaeon]